jgi:hypothetical protein
MGKHISHARQECFVMQREEMELLAVRATLWRMEIEILREIHRYRFAKRGRRFGSDVELMIVYGAAMAHYGFGTPVRALPISRYLEMPRETVRRHMGRLVTLGLLERAEGQAFVPTKELRKVEIERALRLLRHGTAGYCEIRRDPPRLIFAEQLGCGATTGFILYSFHCSQGFHDREIAYPDEADPWIIEIDSHRRQA